MQLMPKLGPGPGSLGPCSGPPPASRSLCIVPHVVESALHTPHTCLESPFWICPKLLLLQGWDILEPSKSVSAPPITTPNKILCAPKLGVQSHIHHGQWAVSTATCPSQGLNPEWIYPGGNLVMLLCLQFIRFSVSSINQAGPSSHTLGNGEDTQGTDRKLLEGWPWQAIILPPLLFLWSFFFITKKRS